MGEQAGTMRGAFIRGDFDVTSYVRPGVRAVVAVLVSPQPHPGVPHEHTVALGVGKNGGETALDGPTFLSTIGWDWLAAVRDRDTGIWLPVTMDSTGPVVIRDTFVTSDLSDTHDMADLKVSATLENKSQAEVSGTVVGTITGTNGQLEEVSFSAAVTIAAGGSEALLLDSASTPELQVLNPKLWWPNGYGPQNLYKLTLRFEVGKDVSQTVATNFGIRKIEYEVPDSEFLTLSVNGVRVMAAGWELGAG